jgi:hypothetical protein
MILSIALHYIALYVCWRDTERKVISIPASKVQKPEDPPEPEAENHEQSDCEYSTIIVYEMTCSAC